MTETKIMSQGRRQIALFSSTGAGVCLGLAGVAAGLWLWPDPPRAPQLGRFEVPAPYSGGESGLAGPQLAGSQLAGPQLAGSPEHAASVRPATFSSSRSPDSTAVDHLAVEHMAASGDLSAGRPPVDGRQSYDRRQLYLETMQRVRSSHRTPAGEAASRDLVAADLGVVERKHRELRFAAEQSSDRSSGGSPGDLGGRPLAAP